MPAAVRLLSGAEKRGTVSSECGRMNCPTDREMTMDTGKNGKKGQRKVAGPVLAVLGLTVLVGAKVPKFSETGMAEWGQAPEQTLLSPFMVDPTPYLGRFVPPGMGFDSVSRSQQLACSSYIQTWETPTGGVERTETMEISSEAAVRLGLPEWTIYGKRAQVGDVRASRRQTVRAVVAYKEMRLMGTSISDPEKFAACCTKRPDQCSDRYIGAATMGTGSVEFLIGTGAELKAGGVEPEDLVGMRVREDKQYSFTVEFPNPTYFKVELSPNIHLADGLDEPGGPGGARGGLETGGSCDDVTWDETPPRGFEIGVGFPQGNEADARRSAMNQAERLAPAGATVEAEAWCGDTETKPFGGDMYIYKVAARVIR